MLNNRVRPSDVVAFCEDGIGEMGDMAGLLETRGVRDGLWEVQEGCDG
jgi:hypothetical protein